MRRLAALLLVGLIGVDPVGPAQAAVRSAQQWQIPAPALLPYHVQAPTTDWPSCHVSDIHATARTRRSTYAALGVVRLRAHHCRIHIANRVVALLDANGHPLDLAIRSAPAANRGVNPGQRPGASAVSWGFAWRGSWCGAQAVYVRVALRGGRTMRIPLPGGEPRCTHDGKPVLIRGSYGFPGQPVQTAPPEWSSLTATLHAAATVPGSTLRGLSVTLTNRSPDTVTLDPCPRYTLMVGSKRGAAAAEPSAELAGCPTTPTFVPANGSRTVHLRAADIRRKDLGPAGTKVTVTFAIAGLAPSAVQTRLD